MAKSSKVKSKSSQPAKRSLLDIVEPNMKLKDTRKKSKSKKKHQIPTDYLTGKPSERETEAKKKIMDSLDLLKRI